MSRYDNSGNGGSSGDYENDTTVKLQKYATLRMEPEAVKTSSHEQYGSSFIVNFDAMEVVDGIVFQREDKPQTVKVFSTDKFFNLNPEDGLVYENFNEEDGYSGQMSAQDILDHPRVAGFSETFAGVDYFYKPLGVVIEEAGEIATNDELEVEVTDDGTIDLEDSSMLLSNKSWTRTFAKKLTEEGDGIINDNGKDGDERDENPKYDAHEWLATDEPTLRSQLEGRSLELWVTEEEMETEDGTQTYGTPNLLDVKTGNFVTIDNGISDGDSDSDADADGEKAAATDGGTKADSGTVESDTDSPETTDSPDSADDSSGLPDGVPDSLEKLIDYLARNDNGDVTAEDVRDFSEDEVENPDEIDWEAAAEEANQRAE